MSLSDLASLGSFVSGAAVLVWLVFLYFQLRQMNAQVRQTEKNQQALIVQARADRAAGVNSDFARDKAFIDTYVRVATDADDVTYAETIQVRVWIMSIFQNAQEAFSQYRRGLLDEYDFDASFLGLKRNLRW